VVVLARQPGDRRSELREPDLLPTLGRDAQGLKPAAYILAIHHFLAGDLLGGPDRLGDDGRVIDPAVVEGFSDLLLWCLALALVDHVLLDVLDGREVAADVVEVEGEIALAVGA